MSRVAVVTGAARGLGRAVVRRLAASGDRVVLLDRDATEGAAVVGKLVAEGGSATFVAVDVADEDAVAAAAREVGDQFGRVDVLVNNAGVAPREGSVVALSRKQWDLVIAVNLTGVYLVSHHFVPLMPPGSSIVNVASTSTLRAVPGTDAYSAAKAGVVGLTKAMAVSLADLGVRVNVISPNVVLTDEVANRLDDPRVEAMLTRTGRPLGRDHATPEEFADLVQFLCSPAAAFLNGANIPFDGGATS